jgi:hypothetical protein
MEIGEIFIVNRWNTHLNVISAISGFDVSIDHEEMDEAESTERNRNEWH